MDKKFYEQLKAVGCTGEHAAYVMMSSRTVPTTVTIKTQGWVGATAATKGAEHRILRNPNGAPVVRHLQRVYTDKPVPFATFLKTDIRPTINALAGKYRTIFDNLLTEVKVAEARDNFKKNEEARVTRNTPAPTPEPTPEEVVNVETHSAIPSVDVSLDSSIDIEGDAEVAPVSEKATKKKNKYAEV